jgi:short-subunit dehydrogenase
MNIIVNGGTRGIGKEIVTILAQKKENKILVTGRNIKSLDSLRNESKFKNIVTLQIDLSLFDSCKNEFKSCVYNNFNKVDVLINNAGALIAREFMNFNNEDARIMMETNFFGPASIIRIVKPLMLKGSHIVNISSMGGFQGSEKYKGLSFYSATKAALTSLSESLAKEFNDEGISVNCLAPGSVQTEMFAKAFPGFKAPVTAIEMAEFISYFAINGNKLFNGKVIPISRNDP